MNDHRIDTEAAMKGLLGPEAPELFCDECFEQLDRYVELELRGDTADHEIPGMRPHLYGCPACFDEYESLRALVRRDAAD